MLSPATSALAPKPVSELNFSALLNLIFLSIFLSSFGVYLGRYQRWNSWDLFTKPFTFFKSMTLQLFEPSALITSIGVTGLFTMFVSLSYLTFYSLNNQKNNI